MMLADCVRRIRDASADLASVAAGLEGILQGEPCQFSQRDPRWRDGLLGYSHKTIGNYGCALCCAAMVASLVEPEITPATLNNRLKQAGGFYNQIVLRWRIVPQVVPGLTFDGRADWRWGLADLEALRQELEQGPIIVQVDSHPGGRLDTHFVLAIDVAGESDLWVFDPWDGAEVRLLLRYAQRSWDLARAVYGMRLLRVREEG